MRRTLALALVIFAVSLTGAVWAYDYFDREDLADKLEKNIGTKVRVVDEIVSVYADNQDIDGYFKFDTLHFRCIIADDKTDAIDYVKKTGTEKKKGARRTKRLVTIQGTVGRPDVYGEVKGKDSGVVSEQILIVVDTAKKPRARYYREFD